MPLVRQKLIESFITILSNLNVEIDELGKIHLLDIHTQAEIFYMHLLNKLFGWDLLNANKTKMNQSGYDLIDEYNKIIVQVTADYSSTKINKTLNNETMESLSNQKYKLKFCFIGEKNKHHKHLSNFKNKYNIDYFPSSDDITLDDLINQFSMIDDMNLQLDIVEFLEKEIGKKFKITDNISSDNLALAFKELGPRYVPEANVNTSINNIYSAFVQDSYFVKELKKLSDFAEKVLQKNEPRDIENNDLNKIIADEKKLAKIITESYIDLNLTNLKYVASESYNMENSLYYCKSNGDAGNWVGFLRKFHEEINTFFDNYLHSVFCKKVMIVHGKAGIGKSHSLAYFLNGLDKTRYLPLLFLGQKIVDNQSPLSQLINMLGVNCDENEFLEELKNYSMLYNKKIVIGIDAINEGYGLVYWKNRLIELVEKLKSANVLTILTIRTDYRKQILVDSQILNDPDVCEYEHEGFENIEYEAIEEYCKYYNLNKPVFPYVEEVYKNPLLLQITCQALSGNGIKDFPRKFSYEYIVDNYINYINRSLSNEFHFGSINLVDKALLSIVNHKDFKYGSLPYESAYLSIMSLINNYGFYELASRLLEKLIERNVLNYSSYSDNSVCFAYELFGDYYRAKSIVDGIKSSNQSEKELAFTKLKELIKDANCIAINRGCIHVLSSLLPDKCGIELYSMCDLTDIRIKESIGEQFISSLLWRESFKLENNKEFLNEVLSSDIGMWREFIYSINRLSVLDFCDLNAEKLNEVLIKLSLSQYEFIWTQELAYDDGLLKIIDWIWKNAYSVPCASLYKYSLLLTWLTASTKKSIRDCATKALVNILIRKPSLIIDLLNNFISCNDIYVVERLFAAIYGACAHTISSYDWTSVCNTIYEMVFGGDETFPNIYVRKYSRLVIEKYCIQNGVAISATFPDIFTTHSLWYKLIPTNDDIDSSVDRIKMRYGENSNEYFAARGIVHSMTTEYGRGTGAYGDFGRYIFGYKVEMWENQYPDQELSNIITYHILNDIYDFELFTSFDRQCASLQHRGEKVERIGKKYQWIGMHELLAKLLDNIIPTKLEKIYSEEEKETISIMEKLI